MAAICYHRWLAQLYLYSGPSLEIVDVPLFKIFLMISEQDIFLNQRKRKHHLQRMRVLQSKCTHYASSSILAIYTTSLSTPHKELITHETVGSNLHTFNPLQGAAALFTIQMIGVGSRDRL